MPFSTVERKAKTPPKFARHYGIGVNKVLALIASGELCAVNVATRPDGRPRWVITPEEQDRFERSRASVPCPAPSVRRSRRQSSGVKEFF